MHVVERYPDGIFSWVDLATTDAEGAKAFYTGLFGWEAVDLPTDMGTTYTMFQIEGKNVAGSGEMHPDLKAQGLPPFWSSYVKHDDVDAIAEKITEAGGTIMMSPMDIMEAGRMVMAQDPTGAIFNVWQPHNHIGAQLVNRPNTLVWNELQTRDGETAKTFYSTVFGWEHQEDESGYVMFSQNGRVHAGLLRMDESWGDIPPNWAVYFFVEDVEATVTRAQELGGSVAVPPTTAGELGAFSVLQDPQGGAFVAMEFNGPVDPPPGA